METAQPLIEIQEHRLELCLPTDSLLLDADPVRMTQVIANLLTNAARYTEPHGRIWVSAVGMCLLIPSLFGVADSGSLGMAIAFLVLFGLGWGFFDCNNMPIL